MSQVSVLSRLSQKCHSSKRVVFSKLVLFHTNPGRFGPGLFRPGSFRPNFGVGRFGLGRWVDSALGRFSLGSFRPRSIPKCRLLRIGRQTNR